MIRSWLAKQLLIRTFAALNRGDAGPTLRMERPDVRFRFPGTSSWATDVRGRDQVALWLRRLTDIGLQHEVEEVVAVGPPWRMRIVLRGIDRLDRDGERIYENRYVIWAETRWGRIADYEVYEDTEKSLALDERLRGASRPGA